MTAVSSRLLRYGRFAVTTAADELFYGGIDEPDTYGHVTRDGWRVRWGITAGRCGEPLAWGRTWTKGGAWASASAAAHCPGARDGAR